MNQDKAGLVLGQCKSNGIISTVVENSSVAELAAEMRISEMDAMALKQPDVDWRGSLAEAFAKMEQEVPPHIVEKAYEIVSEQAKSIPELKELGVDWMMNHRVPLAARCWLRLNIFKDTDDCQPIGQARMSAAADITGSDEYMASPIAKQNIFKAKDDC